MEQVIHKPNPCAFTETMLDAHLKKLGKKKIVLVGEFCFPLFEPHIRTSPNDTDCGPRVYGIADSDISDTAFQAADFL